MKAVIYARYSSDRQREESITSQLRICHDFAERNEIEVIGEYCDRAISGRTDHRPEFQKMIHASGKKLFDAVIVYRLDRFARNRYDSAIYKNKLKKNNVRVLSAMENISSEPEGVILESVLEGMAEYYSLELAQKVLRGMNENAMQGKSNGGNIPNGYRINAATREYEPDPKTAPAVSLIFSLYDGGSTIAEIVSSLKEKGFKTNRGKDYNHSIVSDMLHNKKYIGVNVFKGIEVPGVIPPLIREDEFLRVQKRLESRRKIRKGGGRAKVDYLLTGKIECGKCGGSFVGDSGRSKTGRIYHYYKCINRKNRKTCTADAYSKDKLETYIVQSIRDHVLKDDIIRHIAKRAIQIQTKENEEHHSLTALRFQLRDIDKSLNNLLRALETGIPSETVMRRISELEEQKLHLTARISAEELSQTSLTEDQIVYWLDRFKYGNVGDPAYQRQIIDSLVSKVIISDKKITIVCNYCDDGSSDKKLLVDQDPLYPNLYIGSRYFELHITLHK